MLECKYGRVMQIHWHCYQYDAGARDAGQNIRSSKRWKQIEGRFFLNSTFPSSYHVTSLSDDGYFQEAVCRNGGGERHISKQK